LAKQSTIKDPGPITTDGPITYADVLAAIPRGPDGELLADKTNAAVVRASLGRGGQGTVQRHLNDIRAELEAMKQPSPPQSAPVAPSATVDALWQAAYVAASVHVLSRLEALASQREALQTRLATQDADLEAANAESDRLRDETSAAVVARDAAQSSLVDREAQLISDRDHEHQARLAVEAELARDRESAKHAIELAAAQWEIERRTMQAQIDRLQERLAEMRGLEIWAAGQAGPTTPK